MYSLFCGSLCSFCKISVRTGNTYRMQAYGFLLYAEFVQTFGHFLCTIPTPPTPLPDSQGGYDVLALRAGFYLI